MALQIKYNKVFGVPVAPDAISQGTVSLASYPVITGEFIVNVNLNLKTYTFDLRGIPESLANTIIDICNNNAELLALGEIDLSNPVGEGTFLYRSATCLPFSYQDGGSLQIGTNNANYNSFQVTCLTNVTVTTI